MKRTILSLFLLTSAASAYATVYYWTGTDAYLDYGTVENWKLESEDGETATALPGASDTFYGCKTKYFDLGGGEYTIGGWDSTANWNRYTTYLKNGTLNVAGNVTTHNGTIDLNDGATYNLLAGITYMPALYDANDHQIKVRSGAVFNAYCDYQDYKTSLSVRSGGKAVFNPSSYKINHWSKQTSTFENQAGGELSFPNGLVLGDSTSDDAALKITSAGTLKLGGVFDRNGKLADDTKFTFTISGGKVEAENSVAFSGVTCALTGSAEFSVAENGAIDLTPFTISEVTLTKSGAGSLTLGSSLPSSLNITAGKVILGTAVNISSFTVAAGATLEFGAQNIVVTSATIAEGASFTLSAGVFADGDTVVTSTDADFLAAVQASLAAAGVSTTIADNELVMAASDYVFNSTTVTDLTDPTGWSCGSVPTGKEVRIEGDGVTAIVSGDNLPSFASLAVKKGATLKVTASDVSLPALSLDATGTLVIGDDAESAVTLAMPSLTTAFKVGEDGAVALSKIIVQKGATLTVPAGTNFKNVALELYGTISKDGGTDGEGVRFGYAASGEVTYFAMMSDGGTIDVHSNQNGDNGRHHFLSPASGGRVKAVGAITLKNTSINVNSWADYCETHVGVNNPVDEPFDFILDGTVFLSSYSCKFGGAARVIVKNGAHINRAASCSNHWFGDYVQDSARIVIDGEGSYLDHNISEYGGNLDFNGTAAGEVTVQNGGTYYCQHTGGSGSGTLSVSNGFAKASKVHSDGNRTDFFKGFAAVNVEPESTLGLVADNTASGGDSYDRIVKLANIPITGSGDVFMRNDIADSKPFTVTVVNTANTCTGSIEVKNASGEDYETSLRFADGANWAGTVVAGNISLTNLTDAAATASATFGTLKLAGDFNLRVTDSGCDKLAVGAVVNAGGKIVPVNANGETFEPERGVKYEIMTLAAPAEGESVTLPAIAKGWKVKAVTADDGTVKVMASADSGLVIILR